ncbi:MAG: ATP-dependent zinc protease family protein, partial [Rudaea sp.]
SSLHVDTLQTQERAGRTWLRFSVAASGRRHAPLIECEAPAIGHRMVSDSGGHATLRWFIRTRIELGGVGFDAEINLTNRHNMLFPMLLGRSALGHRFLLDPAASYRCGKPKLKSAAMDGRFSTPMIRDDHKGAR